MQGYYKCLLLVLLVVFSAAKAQEPYSLVHYDESILPQTTIGNIQQDAWGYLWMNTQFGIVRFDGEKIRVFTTSNLKGLTSNRIRLCATDAANTVYFVDENNVIIKVKGPNQFETATTADCIKQWRLPLYSRESNNDFAYFNFDPQTHYKQLADSLKFDLTREFLKSYATGKNEGYFFYVDQQQNVRLCYYHGKEYTLQVQNDLFKAQHTFKLNDLVFCQTSATEAWLFQKAAKGRKVCVTGLPAAFARYFTEESPVLFSSASGTFFYASGNLYQYSIKENAVVATLIFTDLPCTGVVNVMQERTTGDFMISTKSNGFYRIKKKRFSTVNLTGTSKAATGAHTDFNNNIIYALALWDKQHIFCTGYITPVCGTGVSRNYDPANKARFNHYFVYPKDSAHIWLNFGDGIQSFNKQTGRYTPLLKILEPRKVIALSNGTFIIVAARTIVALRNNTVTELYRNDTMDFNTAEKVTEDCLAVGTANGMFYFYPSQKKLQAIPYKTALKVRFLFKDKMNKLWFTTYGQGLFHLSGVSIIPLPVDHAGYLAIGHSIVEDAKSHFWVSTNHGLFRLNYASLLAIIRGQSTKLYHSYFDKTDGFNTNEFNGGCSPSGIYQPETGQLYFPSMDGIVRFHPDSISSASGNSPVFLDEIVVNDTGRVEAAGNPVIFSNQSASIRVDFSSPYYGHAENIKFAYSLSDAPKQWKDLKSSRSIFLNNLPGGSYTLTIKKEGTASTPILATFNFEIEKKFSETLLFKVCVLAVIIALVYLYFKARLYYLNKERNRLEAEVAAKTADQLKLIGQLKDSIARLEQLQREREQMIGHKENIIAVLIHDIKSPLYFLNTVATYLNKNIGLNLPEKNKEIAHEIATSLHRLYLFTQDFAIWLNVSQPGHIQNGEKLASEKIIDEALAIYKEVIEKKGLQIHRQIATGYVYGDEPMIKSVIRNLIDNAVKNTAHGSITLSAGYLPGRQRYEIIVADEGKGMPEERLAALNQYFGSGANTLPAATSGFGHKVIKDFLAKMDGAIHYRHNYATGVVATVNLPAINSLEEEAV